MYEQVITGVGLALLVVLCLPLPRVQKLVLEVSAWALRLTLMALLGSCCLSMVPPGEPAQRRGDGHSQQLPMPKGPCCLEPGAATPRHAAPQPPSWQCFSRCSRSSTSAASWPAAALAPPARPRGSAGGGRAAALYSRAAAGNAAFRPAPAGSGSAGGRRGHGGGRIS